MEKQYNWQFVFEIFTKFSRVHSIEDTSWMDSTFSQTKIDNINFAVYLLRIDNFGLR